MPTFRPESYLLDSRALHPVSNCSGCPAGRIGLPGSEVIRQAVMG